MGIQDYVSRITPLHFTSLKWWAEEVYYTPKGDPGRRTKIVAVVDEANAEGSNEVAGDGKVLEKQVGRTLRYSMYIEVNKADVVRSELEGNAPCVFHVFHDATEQQQYEAGNKNAGIPYRAKRITSTDRDTITILCVQVKRVTIRRESRRG